MTTLRQARHRITLPGRGPGLHDVTEEIRSWAESQGLMEGLLTVYCRHTSASLVIQENADPDVQRDLEAFLHKLVPQDPRLYRHTTEGPDDMPAHIKAALTQTQVSVPLLEGRLGLGTWQGIYLFEHRTAPHRRELLLHLLGE